MTADVRRSNRTKRPPTRLEEFGDDELTNLAKRRSLYDTRRPQVEYQAVPTFYPTPEEIQDLLQYISKVTECAASDTCSSIEAGMIRIVTPAGWRPKFDLCRFETAMRGKHFDTKRQDISKLQEHQAFQEGGCYTWDQYRWNADNFSEAFVERNEKLVAQMEQAALEENGAEKVARLLEEEYWQYVEGLKVLEGGGPLVDYASDLNSVTYASGFGARTAERNWDLNNLATQPQSLLSKLDGHVEGLTQPWLYFGWLFATFCWHTEDHWMYSINYHHTGAPKTWYSISGQYENDFRKALRMHAPERLKQDPDLVHQLVAMVPPSALANAGFANKIYRTVQRPGDIIITLPRAYHSGFSHGWNCTEACNFALLDWVPHGSQAVYLYATERLYKRAPVFSHEKLIWKVVAELTSQLQLVPVESHTTATKGESAAESGAKPSQSPEESRTSKSPVVLTAAQGTPIMVVAGAVAPAGAVQPAAAHSQEVKVEVHAVALSVASSLEVLPEDMEVELVCPSAADVKQEAGALGFSAAAAPGPPWHLRDYCRLLLEVAPERLKQLPAQVAGDASECRALLADKYNLSHNAMDEDVLESVHAAFRHMVAEELHNRLDHRWSKGAKKKLTFRKIESSRGTAADDQHNCRQCKALPYWSRIYCSCPDASPRCWHHAELSSCSCRQLEVHVTHSNEELAIMAYKLCCLQSKERQTSTLFSFHKEGALRGPRGLKGPKAHRWTQQGATATNGSSQMKHETMALQQGCHKEASPPLPSTSQHAASASLLPVPAPYQQPLGPSPMIPSQQPADATAPVVPASHLPTQQSVLLVPAQQPPLCTAHLPYSGTQQPVLSTDSLTCRETS